MPVKLTTTRNRLPAVLGIVVALLIAATPPVLGTPDDPVDVAQTHARTSQTHA
jgi:hypothetical protein